MKKHTRIGWLLAASLTAAFLAATITPALADTLYWQASTDNDWSTGSNWDLDTVPAEGDTVRIQNGLSESDRAESSHDYGDGSTYTVTSGWDDQLGNLQVGALGEGEGRLDIVSGANMALARNGNHWIGARGSSAEINQSGGAFYGHTSNGVDATGEIGGVGLGINKGTDGSTGVYNLSGGFFSQPYRGALVVGAGGNSTGEFNMSGGKFYSAGDHGEDGGLHIGRDTGSTGLMNIEGTWTDSLIQVGGYQQGMAGGQGTLQLQFDSGGVTPIQVEADLGERGSSGNVTLGDGAELDVGFLDQEEYGTWEVMSWDGDLLDESGAVITTAEDANNILPFASSVDPDIWQKEWSFSGSGSLSITAVPEPSSLVLLGIAGLLLMKRRRL